MNCREVQLQLSVYLDKSLDAIRMKSIETHLSSCPFCRAEVHSLSDCIRLVSDLPILEPPAGFAQRVMAHAREIDIEPHSWERFFAAFKVTLPVQAAAVVLVSVLAVLLYQKEPQIKNFTFIEMPGRPTIPLQAEEKSNLSIESAPSAPPQAPRASITKRKVEAGVESVPEPVVEARKRPGAATMKDAPVTPQLPAAAEPEKPTEKALEGGIATARRPAIQAQEVSTSNDSPRPSADALGIGAAIGALSRSPFRASPFSAERALSPLSEPNPDFEFVVKRRPSERRDKREAASSEALSKRSEATVAMSASERSATPSAPPANQVVEIRWFTVAPQHYEQFKKELAAEAIIDSEKPVAAKENDFGLKTPRELLIKVTILPSER